MAGKRIQGEDSINCDPQPTKNDTADTKPVIHEKLWKLSQPSKE
jgi:hypothetical protein